MWDQIKRLAVGAFAMEATERNKSFREDVSLLVGKSGPVHSPPVANDSAFLSD